MDVNENWGAREKGAIRQKKRLWRKRRGPSLYLDPMANVIQAAEVEGFPVVGSERR